MRSKVSRPAEPSTLTALGRGRLVFSSGVACDVSLIELTDDRGGEYTWFHTVSGGGPIGDVLDWVFRRPGPQTPSQIRVYANPDRAHAAVAEFADPDRR